jgi:carboxymethylenebutenolidase
MMSRAPLPALALALAAVSTLAACARRTPAPDEHADHMRAEAAGSVAAAPSSQTAQGTALPAGANDAPARLAASPRHGEFAMIPAGNGDSVRAWVVYPERRDKAPVVLVVHEIYGLSNWVRAVADQLAAEGFIAVAPDLITGQNVPEANGDPDRTAATAAIRALKPEDVQRRLDAAAKYGTALPAATKKYGIVGFCWGGSTSFMHAVHAPSLGASVVYYGGSPPADSLRSVRAPVLGFYGENDARVNSTIPRADSTLTALGRTYEYSILPGAGHGFLRQQDGMNGANLEASKQAWPRTVAWFRKHLN